MENCWQWSLESDSWKSWIARIDNLVLKWMIWGSFRRRRVGIKLGEREADNYNVISLGGRDELSEWKGGQWRVNCLWARVVHCFTPGEAVLNRGKSKQARTTELLYHWEGTNPTPTGTNQSSITPAQVATAKERWREKITFTQQTSTHGTQRKWLASSTLHQLEFQLHKSSAPLKSKAEEKTQQSRKQASKQTNKQTTRTRTKTKTKKVNFKLGSTVCLFILFCFVCSVCLFCLFCLLCLFVYFVLFALFACFVLFVCVCGVCVSLVSA